MFLLILVRITANAIYTDFTFHNVSINTLLRTCRHTFLPSLHSTMFLLIQKYNIRPESLDGSLHSTMFLLILQIDSREHQKVIDFTFHNVSINTTKRPRLCINLSALHSTMFLLILCGDLRNSFALKSLHSTMFLLIQPQLCKLPRTRWNFTFHNVSINTKLYELFKGTEYVFTFHNVSINTIHRRTL